VRGDDVDGLEARGTGVGVGMEGREEEDEEDEAVFAAVVGEGEFVEAEDVVESVGRRGRLAIGLRRYVSRALAYVYLFRASSITPSEVRVCSWTFFNRSSGGSSARNALTRAWSSAQSGWRASLSSPLTVC